MMGSTLQLVRKYHRLNQKQLADKLGVSPAYLSELEGNHKKPTISILEKYQEAFGLPTSSLVYMHEALENGQGRGIAKKAIRILKWASE